MLLTWFYILLPPTKNIVRASCIPHKSQNKDKRKEYSYSLQTVLATIFHQIQTG